MKEFFVNDFACLKDYGFEKNKNGDYTLRTFRATNVVVDGETGRLTFYSPSSDLMAILCEMYKEGVLEFMSCEKKDMFRMMLTEEEVHLICKKRRGLYNEQELGK